MAVQRWTDEMIDGLASSVVETRESITALRESMAQSNAELRESIVEARKSMAQSNAELRESMAQSNAELREEMDGIRITTQALLQVAGQTQRRMEAFEDRMEAFDQNMAEMKQRQAENDKRFYVLLAEVRYLIHGNQQD